MKTTHTPKNRCLYCGHELDAASDMESDAVPGPGDVSLCIKCGGVLIFCDDMSLRMPTEVDAASLTDEQLLDINRKQCLIRGLSAQNET